MMRKMIWGSRSNESVMVKERYSQRHIDLTFQKVYNLNMKIKELVYKKLKLLTKQTFDDKSDIYNIGIDSLDLVELVTEVEDEYDVMVSDADLEAIKTVEDIVKVFEKLQK